MSDKLLSVRYKCEPSLFSFSGFSIGRLTDQRSCMIQSVWWTPTFSIIARRSPGASWASICSLSSIISTGKSKFTVFSVHGCLISFQWCKSCNYIITSTIFSLFFSSIVYFLLKYGLRLGELLIDRRPWGVRQTQRNKWRHQRSLSPCILPITGLGFWQSDLGRNKKPNLSDNVNVSVASARLYRFIPDTAVGRPDTFLMDWNQRERGRSRCLCCLWPIVQNNNIFLKGWSPPPHPNPPTPNAALTDPVAQLTVNLQTLRGWKTK